MTLEDARKILDWESERKKIFGGGEDAEEELFNALDLEDRREPAPEYVTDGDFRKAIKTLLRV